MDTKNPKNIINVLYFFLVLSTILSFVPTQAGQIGSLVLILVTLLAAYFYKSRDSEDGLLYNHMTYMIGTIWIGTGFILLGVIAAAIWVTVKGDHSLIQTAIDQVSAGQAIDEAAMQTLMMDYMQANKDLLIMASIPTIGPAILYFVYRVANGFGRASKGYRIANPKSWL
jgi:uncharacterized membrane protein